MDTCLSVPRTALEKVVSPIIETALTGITTAALPHARPFALGFARPAVPEPVAPPYTYDALRQLNVLPDGRAAVQERAVLLASGTTTSTAGSKTHFDD